MKKLMAVIALSLIVIAAVQWLDRRDRLDKEEAAAQAEVKRIEAMNLRWQREQERLKAEDERKAADEQAKLDEVQRHVDETQCATYYEGRRISPHVDLSILPEKPPAPPPEFLKKK